LKAVKIKVPPLITMFEGDVEWMSGNLVSTKGAGFSALSDQNDGNTVKYLAPYIPIFGLIQTV